MLYEKYNYIHIYSSMYFFSKTKYAKVLDSFELFTAKILSPTFDGRNYKKSIDIFSASCFFPLPCITTYGIKKQS